MPPPRPRMVLFAAALCVTAMVALAAHQRPRPAAPVLAWTETAWRHPLDNWGTGRAWRATAPDGSEVTLHVRTKTGFCNCFGGIADDAEIDRIGDVDLHGDDFAPLSPGTPVALGDLAGRARSFRASGKWGGARHVLSIVAAADCKAVVATLVSPAPISSETQAAATALLLGGDIRRWAANQ